MRPIRIDLVDDSTAIALTWPDLGPRRLGAEDLRRASRAASEIRRQIEGVALSIAPGLCVLDIEPIGNYAVRLSFSDGHDRGIYPWSYLRELAELHAI